MQSMAAHGLGSAASWLYDERFVTQRHHLLCTSRMTIVTSDLALFETEENFQLEGG
jgi:hypothetical protein